MYFLAIRTNGSTSTQWENTSTAARQTSTNHYQEGLQRERKISRSVIIECRLRRRRMRNGDIKKYQSLN